MAQLCIDIGGTNTLIGVGNEDLSRVMTVPSDTFLTNMQQTINDTLDATVYDRDAIQDVKVAAAGPVDTEGTPTFFPPNIEQETISLSPLTQIGSFELYNDCHAAAMGEYKESDVDGRLIYLTLSTGIGAGIVDHGELQTGGGNAGEIGHIITGADDITCGCGGKDHWEAHCGGANLPTVAEKLYNSSFDTAKEIFDAYYNGDDRADPIINHIRSHNRKGLIATINAYDPDIIRIGGGIGSNHYDVLFSDIEAQIEQDLMTSMPIIEPAKLGEQSVLQGLSSL